MNGKILLVLGLLAVSGCTTDGDEGDEGGTDTEDGTGTGDPGQVFACGELHPDADFQACSPTPLDYQPGADDAWPACATDDGSYPLVSDSPSSIARVEAYEEVVAMISGPDAPTTDDFTMARAIYSEDEGLESRLQRREDLHFDPVPESAWDPGVDGDKQCTVQANVDAYSERCAGPARIAPIINEAFAAGQTGEGSALVHAARIEGALTWFLYLSVYKEANTCFSGAAKDCDSSWAYYTGGFDRQGGIGFSALVRASEPATHTAIWDGFAAFRCLRELAPADDDPSVSDLDEDQQGLLCSAQAQLDTALNRGLAVVLRDEVDSQAGATAGEELDASWAYVEVVAEGLGRVVRLNDPGAADALAAAVTARDAQATVAAIDAAVPCA